MKHRWINKEVSLTTLAALILALILPAFFSSLLISNTHAIASSISISLSSAPTVNLASSSEGKFSDSGNSTITITTNHAAGYTLTAKAKNSTSLESTYGGSIPSISSPVTPANYADNTYAASNNLNDTWAYKPSVLYNSSTETTDSNTDYLPSPGTGTAQSPIDTLAITNNASNGNYTVSIGTRVTTATNIDSYSNEFVFTVVGNPTPYAINYNQNTTDTVTNMPTNHATSDPGVAGETVTIDSTVPVRDGYTFKGWCSVSTSDDTCSGTIYNPDGGGTTLSLTVNQQSASNAFTLYAMWSRSVTLEDSYANAGKTKLNGYYKIQDMADTNANICENTTAIPSELQVIDIRDNKVYWIAKLEDNHCWMTQNLDLEIGGANTATLTSENTDLNTSSSGPYYTDYSTSGGIITWQPTLANTNATVTGTPAQITNYASGGPSNSVTGWTNDSCDPYMAEGGDHYVYTSGVDDTSTLDTIYNSLNACTTAGHTAEDCAHYHAGNYYNWPAAIASSNSLAIFTQYNIADNSICPKGWRLPKGTAGTDTATTREFGELWRASGIISSLTESSYAANGFLNIRQTPLYFARGGFIYHTGFYSGASAGRWWSSSVDSISSAYHGWSGATITSAGSGNRLNGSSVRCIAR